MSYYARSVIERLTWGSIQTPENAYDGNGYPCGCRPHPQRPDKSFHLCPYHEGFDDGVFAARAASGAGYL